MKPLLRILLSAFMASLLVACQSTDHQAMPTTPQLRRNVQQGNPVPVHESKQQTTVTAKKIALLLPSSGPYATAAGEIQHGFFSMYYRDKQNNSNAPQIDVIDTSQMAIQAAYQQALTDGANLIVGPLTKSNVQAMANLGHLQVPTLALNDVNGSANIDNHFLEYSLAPEQEVQQLSHLMHQANYQHALVIRLNNAWGERVADAFKNQWQQLGGDVVDSLSVSSDDDFAHKIRDFLHFEGNVRDYVDVNDQQADPSGQTQHNSDESDSNSDNQQAPVSTITAKPLAKRRYDFDVIFLAVPPSIARQIQPLLKFYYAGSVPVFSPSIVFSGQMQATADRDLNGIVFVDMPGLLKPHNHLQQQTQPRLYAFGQDSYRLITNINTLLQGQTITGVSGLLSLQTNGVVYRQLQFARFRQGLPQVIHSIKARSDDSANTSS